MICKEEINELLPPKKEKQQNQYSSTDDISAIRKNICLTKHLLSRVPEVFSRVRRGAFARCGPREKNAGQFKEKEK